MLPVLETWAKLKEYSEKKNADARQSDIKCPSGSYMISLTISFQREGPLSTLMTAIKDPAQSSVSYNKQTFSQETI